MIKLDPNSSSILDPTASVDVNFSLHFDREGRIVGVDTPGNVPLTVLSMDELEDPNVNALQNVSGVFSIELVRTKGLGICGFHHRPCKYICW